MLLRTTIARTLARRATVAPRHATLLRCGSASVPRRAYHWWPRFPAQWLPPAPPLPPRGTLESVALDPPISVEYPHQALAAIIDIFHSSLGVSWVATGVLWVVVTRSAMAPLLYLNLKASYVSGTQTRNTLFSVQRIVLK